MSCRLELEEHTRAETLMRIESADAPAAVFLGNLLSRHMTGQEVRAEANSIIERAVASGLP